MASVWLRKAANIIAHDIFSPVGEQIDMRKVDVSFGFPVNDQATDYVGGLTDYSRGGAIVITPIDDPLHVLGVLVHEMVHIQTPGDEHGSEFGRIARAVGLVGPLKNALAGEELKNRLKAVFDAIGPMPTPFAAAPPAKSFMVERRDGSFVAVASKEVWQPQRNGREVKPE